MNVYRDKVAHLALDEESIYVQSTGGAVTAFDTETGQKRWAVQLGREDVPSYAATSNDEIVLINAGVFMHAIKKRPVEDPRNPGQIALRPMMYLALSYDHRIIDGAEAVTLCEIAPLSDQFRKTNCCPVAPACGVVVAIV